MPTFTFNVLAGSTAAPQIVDLKGVYAVVDPNFTFAPIGNTTVGAGSYGSNTVWPTFTVNSEGRLTVAANSTPTFGGDATGSVAALVVQQASGDFKIVTVGKGLYVKEGANAAMGTATLVGGTILVSTTKVTANSRIFLSNQDGAGTPGALYVSARVAGTSFTITSTSGTDTGLVAWMIVEPA